MRLLRGVPLSRECVSRTVEQCGRRIDAVGEQLQRRQRGAQEPRGTQLVHSEGAGDLGAHNDGSEADQGQQQSRHLGVAHRFEHPGVALFGEHGAGVGEEAVEQSIGSSRTVDEHPREVVDVGAVALEVVEGGADAVAGRRDDEVVLLVDEDADHVVVALAAEGVLVAEVMHDQSRADTGLPGDRAQARGVVAIAGEGGDGGVADAGASRDVVGD